MILKLIRLVVAAIRFRSAALYRQNVMRAEERIPKSSHARRMWHADMIIANDAYQGARVKFMNAANAFEVVP
jgi:hypothetical protein